MWVGFAVFGSIVMLTAWADSRREVSGSRLRDLLKPPSINEQLASMDAEFKQQSFRRALSKLQSFTKNIVPSQALEDLNKKLAWAGNPRNLTPEEFYSAKLVSAAIFFGVTTVFGVLGSGTKSLLVALTMGIVGYLFPDKWLDRLTATRQRQIEAKLLSFVEMLAVTCEAGLPLKDAVDRVSEHSGGILGVEFQRTFREISLGRSPVDAYEALGDRNGVDELRFLTTALAQATKHGTPMAKVLRAQVKDLRAGRQNRASEIAQKASVKMLLPTVGCMFLPMMVLLLGPAVVNLSRSLGF